MQSVLHDAQQQQRQSNPASSAKLIPSGFLPIKHQDGLRRLPGRDDREHEKPHRQTLDEWLAFDPLQLPAERKGQLQWLKQRFDLKQNTAYLILGRLDEMDGTSLYAHGDALLNDLFDGRSQALHGL